MIFFFLFYFALSCRGSFHGGGGMLGWRVRGWEREAAGESGSFVRVAGAHSREHLLQNRTRKKKTSWFPCSSHYVNDYYLEAN